MRRALNQATVLWVYQSKPKIPHPAENSLSSAFSELRAEGLGEALKLLTTHSIAAVILPEASWGDLQAEAILSIQRRRHLPIVVLGTHASVAIATKLDVSFVDETIMDVTLRASQKSLETTLRELLQLKLPPMPPNKQFLIEQIAWRTAARFQPEVWAEHSDDLTALLRPGEQSRWQAELDRLSSKTLRLAIRKSRFRESFFSQLLRDVENTYWSQVSSALAEGGVCDLGNWGIFSANRQEDNRLQFSFGGGEGLREFAQNVPESHFSKNFTQVIAFIHSQVVVHKAGGKAQFPLVSAFSKSLAEIGASNQPDMADAGSELRGMERRGLFGLDVLTTSYTGCLAWAHSIAKGLEKEGTVMFLGMGSLLTMGDTLKFDVDPYLFDLVSANIPLSRRVGGSL